MVCLNIENTYCKLTNMGFFDAFLSLAVDVVEPVTVEPSAIVCEIERNESYECNEARNLSDASNADAALDAMEEEKRD